MKKLVIILFAMSFLVFGCLGPKVSPNAVKLGVDFNFEGHHKCSASSPKITVSNIPPGTKKLSVTLVDQDVPTWNHGGGTISNDGSGVIPEGALKAGYNGPCPPSGSHTYVFSVNAIDGEGVIVGQGEKAQVFP
jgi:phosphatidylethanolamine-binding protein (PEBP) family uncharacterized protein